MKVKWKRIVEGTCDINIGGITLLSVEEHEACREHVPPFNDIWWLRSPGYNSKYAASVSRNGNAFSSGINVDYDLAVRPALKLAGLKSANLQIGDWFRLFGHDWTVVSDTHALCNDSIGESPFREDYEAEDANNYETSDIKMFVEKWLARQLAGV